ncbi:MAG: hypothetical protein P4M00_04375 [Azospirillaceae bacterium]|nr:hypothetical protein [Azospirillaceae bacterium]
MPNSFSEAEVTWIAEFVGSSVSSGAAAEGRALKQEAVLKSVYGNMDYLADELGSAFSFEISRESSHAIKRAFNVRKSFKGVSDDHDAGKELDAYWDLRRFAGSNPPANDDDDDRMEQTVSMIETAKQQGKIEISGGDDSIGKLKTAIGEVKRMLTTMEEAVDESGQRLFSDEDIMERLFKPMIRQGVFPESFVPDKYSEVAKVFGGASEAYMDRLIEGTAKGTINDTKHNANFAVSVCKKTTDVALTTVKVVDACGGPANAVKYAKFAQTAVMLTAQGIKLILTKDDADSVVDALKSALTAAVGAFVKSEALEGILTGAISATFGAGTGAYKLIARGDVSGALESLGDAIGGVFSAVAATKDDAVAANLNRIGASLTLGFKMAAPAIKTIKGLREGEGFSSLAVELLKKEMGVIGAGVIQQTVIELGAIETKKEVDKARDEGKSDEELADLQKDKDDEVSDTASETGETMGEIPENVATLLAGLKDTFTKAGRDPELQKKIEAAVARAANSADGTVNAMTAGIVTDGALGDAYFLLGRPKPAAVAEDPSRDAVRTALLDAQNALVAIKDQEVVVKGVKIKVEVAFAKEFSTRFLMSLDDFIATEVPRLSEKGGAENNDSRAAVAFCRDYPAYVAAQQKLATLASPQALANLKTEVEEKKRQELVATAQKAILDDADKDARVFREALAQGFSLPTDPEELALQETSREMSKIAPMIKQLKADQDLFDVAMTVVKGGADVLAAFFPPAEIVAAAAAMMAELNKAIKRQQEFLLWRQNKTDARNAASVQMEAFLNKANIANSQTIQHGIQAAVHLMEMLAAMIETVGMATHAAMGAGAAVQIAGKAAKLAAQATGQLIDLIYTVKGEVELRSAWNDFQVALDNPKSRRKARQAIRANPTLAKYAIAYGAVEGNDPVAKMAMQRCGLNEKTLADADTNVQAVVDYLEALYPEDPILEREVATSKWFPSTSFVPTFKDWNAFLLAADPKLGGDKGKAVAKVLVNLDTARAAFVVADKALRDKSLPDRTEADAAARLAAIERVAFRIDESGAALRAYRAIGSDDKPHHAMANATIGFIQSLNDVRVEFLKARNENATLYVPVLVNAVV